MGAGAPLARSLGFAALGAHRGLLSSKGQPAGMGFPDGSSGEGPIWGGAHLGRGPEGSHCSPFPWGSAGTSCPWLTASPQGGAQELSSKFFKPPGHRFPIRTLPAPGGRHRAELR